VTIREWAGNSNVIVTYRAGRHKAAA